MTDDIKDGETVCKHDKRPFECSICYPIGVKPCCDNEERNMNGGCVNCGDPCL